jgi:hypothetical protein
MIPSSSVHSFGVNSSGNSVVEEWLWVKAVVGFDFKISDGGFVRIQELLIYFDETFRVGLQHPPFGIIRSF